MTTVSRPGARRRYRLLNTISILTFAALALAGCSGNGSDSKTMSDAGGGDSAGVLADQPAPAADAEKAAMELQDTSAAAAGSEPTAPLRERAIIANGAVGLEVKDIKSVATKIRGLVSSQGGLVASEEADLGGGNDFGYLAMTVRVPSAKFDDTLTRLGELGKQTNLSRGVEDVTTQVIDVDARIAAQQASVRRLETLMGKAESLSDIVALEGELTRRQADLDSLKGQQAWLRDQTSMATISITLSTPDTHPNGEPNGFVAGVKRGWAGLGQAIGAGLTILGLLLPFLVLALIVGVPLWWVRRNRKAARQAPVSPATPAQTE